MKKVISILLSCMMLLSGCVNQSNANSSMSSLEENISSIRPNQQEISSTITSMKNSEISTNVEQKDNLTYKSYQGETHTLNFKNPLTVNYTGELPSSWLPRHNYDPISQNETYRKDLNNINEDNYAILNIFINQGDNTNSGKTGFPFLVTEKNTPNKILTIGELTIYHCSYQKTKENDTYYYDIYSSYVATKNISPVLVKTEKSTKENFSEQNNSLSEEDIYQIIHSISNVEFSEMSETTLGGDEDRQEIPEQYTYNKEYMDFLGIFISFRSAEEFEFLENSNSITSIFTLYEQVYNLTIEIIPIDSENIEESIGKEMNENYSNNFMIPKYQGKKMVFNFLSEEGHYYSIFIYQFENINYMIKIDLSSEDAIKALYRIELELEPIITTFELAKK